MYGLFLEQAESVAARSGNAPYKKKAERLARLACFSITELLFSF
jgi:hypothetical protein